ncbi:MAG: magnesium transporter CorA family protein [Bdellovibrionales bacterium]|nr:magnesium transporter CorA family protein [Ramlibacter sp.]
MRVFTISAPGAPVAETSVLPVSLPATGFIWISCTRTEFERELGLIQACLQNLCGTQIVELHVSDLLNNHLPSHYDYTSQYDMLVFRRLAATLDDPAPGPDGTAPPPAHPAQVLKRIDTSPVGFAIFDRLLLTVHPDDCAVRDAYAARLLSAAAPDTRMATGTRLPASPADLMLRIVNQMVDGYLDLRRELSRQLDHWQKELLQPRSRFNHWAALMEARLSLHQLDEICEDQRSAAQDWIDSLETWPDPATPAAQRERDLLKVRSRDVLEHIERVIHHVQRLEQNAETAVQMHFSAQSNRTNDIMRTLTALTAVFLPLNLIAGIFGMNFEFIPLLHKQGGFWIAVGAMVVIATVLILVFWRKRYLARTRG